MIDRIILTKSKVTENELQNIVRCANLQECSRNGVVYYESSLQQINREHIYIKIAANKRLKIVLNLHKQYERSITKSLTNYGEFTVYQALETIGVILESRGISTDNLKVPYFEIGLNLFVSQDCREYTDKIQSIGVGKKSKPIYVNPKYKNERVKTTEFHKNTRKYFKVYDKCFEAHDKGRKDVPEYNILRLETVYQRQSISYGNFFTVTNLEKLRDIFFREWQRLQFNRELEAIKGIRAAKRELCKEILNSSPLETLETARVRHKKGCITDREFRGIREFINNDWNNIKNSIKFTQSIEEQEFRKLLNVNKTLHKISDNNVKNNHR